MYRDVRELNKDELDELRWSYYWELVDTGEDEGIEWADDIPDAVLFEHYDGICFVEEDFWCNSDKEAV